MYRRRSSARKYTRRIKTVKYSNETAAVSGIWEITDGKQNILLGMIPSIEQQGVRKCKNFELSMVSQQWSNNENVPVFWALVYVPEGTEANALHLGAGDVTASLYEPNQNVIMSGVWPSNQTANYKVKTRLARNLNAGDSIWLVLRTAATVANNVTKPYAISMNYAISF